MRTLNTIRLNPGAMGSFADIRGNILDEVKGGHEVSDIAFYARRVLTGEAVMVAPAEIVSVPNRPRKTDMTK